jgi:S1-C subfamily serine protease
VLSLEPEGPAAKAGVLIGDILIGLEGAAVADTEDIQAVLENRPVGRSVDAHFLRGGDSRNITIIVGERPRRS